MAKISDAEVARITAKLVRLLPRRAQFILLVDAGEGAVMLSPYGIRVAREMLINALSQIDPSARPDLTMSVPVGPPKNGGN